MWFKEDGAVCRNCNSTSHSWTHSGLAIFFRESSSTHKEAISTETTTESDTRDSRSLFGPTDTNKEQKGMVSENTPKLSIIVAIVMKKR